MDSQTMVNRYEAKLEGQQLLWEDHDMILRNTPFKSIDPDFDREALVHWWMNVYLPDGSGDQATPYEVFHSWSNAMWGRFKHVFTNGYNPISHQTSIKLGCVKSAPLEPQVADLKMWLPHIKETPLGEEAKVGKYVSIFEHSLSEHGSYDLKIYNDTDFVVAKSAWRHPQILKQTTTLEAAVDFIRKNVWYETGEEDE